jgi:hypothetical protein
VTFSQVLFVGLPIFCLAGCGENLDAPMWECQFEVQKGNAGKSADAAAERARDIESCMRDRGYKLDVKNPSCQNGSVQSSCYRSK